ncbi:MAG: hypothetical protein WBW33_02210 [Bryobacteraceae bacterium]
MRMENLKSTFAVLMALVLCLASVGCWSGTTSGLITALNVVSDAANVAVVLTSSLAAAGKVDPAVAAEVSAYATGIGTAVNTAVSELDSSDPNPQKILVITTAFANVTVPAFGPNAPEVSAVINAVSAAVQVLLSQLNSTGLTAMARTAPTATVSLTWPDKSALKAIKKKTAETLVKAAALKAIH